MVRVVSVKVDYTKCPDTTECTKCIDACRGGVLLAQPVSDFFAKQVKRKIDPGFMSLCIGCGECQRVCPKGAISVS